MEKNQYMKSSYPLYISSQISLRQTRMKEQKVTDFKEDITEVIRCLLRDCGEGRSNKLPSVGTIGSTAGTEYSSDTGSSISVLSSFSTESWVDDVLCSDVSEVDKPSCRLKCSVEFSLKLVPIP